MHVALEISQSKRKANSWATQGDVWALMSAWSLTLPLLINDLRWWALPVIITGWALACGVIASNKWPNSTSMIFRGWAGTQLLTIGGSLAVLSIYNSPLIGKYGRVSWKATAILFSLSVALVVAGSLIKDRHPNQMKSIWRRDS